MLFLLTMTTTRDENQPCCPGATQGDYVSKGKVITLGDMFVYEVSPANPKIGIVLNYDIFGLEICGTRAFCDRLSEETGYAVVMGDYFRGNAWSLKDYPFSDHDAFMTWVNSFSDNKLAEDVETLRSYLVEKGIEKIGIIGFCWGGKVSILGAKTGQFQAAAAMHGAFIQDSDAPDIKCPLLLIDAGDDPDRSNIAKVLKANPDIGPKSDFLRYDDMEHGWTNRGDKTVPRVKECMDEAFGQAKSFFQECLE